MTMVGIGFGATLAIASAFKAGTMRGNGFWVAASVVIQAATVFLALSA